MKYVPSLAYTSYSVKRVEGGYTDTQAIIIYSFCNLSNLAQPLKQLIVLITLSLFKGLT